MINRRQYSAALCASLLALGSGCGGSKPIQEEPNAPGGGTPSTPGPQTGETIGPARAAEPAAGPDEGTPPTPPASNPSGGPPR